MSLHSLITKLRNNPEQEQTRTFSMQSYENTPSESDYALSHYEVTNASRRAARKRVSSTRQKCAGIAAKGGTPTTQRHANGKLSYVIDSVPTAEGGRGATARKSQTANSSRAKGELRRAKRCRNAKRHNEATILNVREPSVSPP